MRVVRPHRAPGAASTRFCLPAAGGQDGGVKGRLATGHRLDRHSRAHRRGRRAGRHPDQPDGRRVGAPRIQPVDQRRDRRGGRRPGVAPAAVTHARRPAGRLTVVVAAATSPRLDEGRRERRPRPPRVAHAAGRRHPTARRGQRGLDRPGGRSPAGGGGGRSGHRRSGPASPSATIGGRSLLAAGCGGGRRLGRGLQRPPRGRRLRDRTAGRARTCAPCAAGRRCWTRWWSRSPRRP